MTIRMTWHSIAIGVAQIWLYLLPVVLSAQTLEWAHQFGTTGSDSAQAVAVDGSGVYVIGEFSAGTIGSSNFVRKLDANGSEIWMKQFSAGNLSDATGSGDGIHVVGSSSSDAFVRKFDVNGTELWTRTLGSSRVDEAYAVAADPSGVYVVGYAGDALAGQAGSGGRDAFIRKYDNEGDVLWTKQFGTTGTDEARGVAVAGTAVYVIGNS
jgi:hypothetical protein